MKLFHPFFRWFLTIPLWFVAAAILTGCTWSNDQKQPELELGIWRGTLLIQGHLLPFNFEVSRPELKTYVIDFINGEERIPVDEVRIWGDSIFIGMHIFDTEIKARINKRKLQGVWSKKYAEGYSVPFNASHGSHYRFAANQPPQVDVSGKWRVEFSEDSLPGVGIFSQNGSHLSGTFLTSKGDYRYLDGVVSSDSLYLSTFDGEHAFLFTARANGNEITVGEFRSGITWMESWSAVRDPNAVLSDQDSLTYLKPGYDKLNFSFPDLNGKTVTLEDEKYQDQIVLLQIFGTWCPNCLDETRFLSNWYQKNRHQPVEIIGLAYERLDDYSYAKKRVNKMIMRLDVEYDFLIAGSSDKVLASETLPMLNHIMSFPTTIFIDHKRNVRRIYTGFSGPGTGSYYYEFVDDFNLYMDKLIAEKIADTLEMSF